MQSSRFVGNIVPSIPVCGKFISSTKETPPGFAVLWQRLWSCIAASWEKWPLLWHTGIERWCKYIFNFLHFTLYIFSKEYKYQMTDGSFQIKSSSQKKMYTPPCQIFMQFFLQRLWTNITTRIFPVSYTHLDVYKRQGTVIVIGPRVSYWFLFI